MDIELLTIGTELLLGFTIDTNAAELGQALSSQGIRVLRHTSVGDDPVHIAQSLSDALSRSGVVITTGGLGPTKDDISRDVVADVMGMPLQFDDHVWEGLRERYRELGRDLPESNRPQAMVPTGATILPNRWGTAPGLWLETARGLVIMLPGVPFEMRLLLRHEVIPRLVSHAGDSGTVIRSRTLRTVGIGESLLAEKIGDLADELTPLSLAYLPQTGSVDLRLTAWQLPGKDADALLREKGALLKERVFQWCYGEDDDDLAAHILQLLRERHLTLALGESCTGGLLGGRLTNIPGSSSVFFGGVVCYADSAKEQLLDVPRRVIEEFGAVSAETAMAMATGAARSFGADVGVGITGIAGPDGGTDAKPVGTVWFGYSIGGTPSSAHAAFPGTRHEIRERAVTTAMAGLRRRLLDA